MYASWLLLDYIFRGGMAPNFLPLQNVRGGTTPDQTQTKKFINYKIIQKLIFEKIHCSAAHMIYLLDTTTRAAVRSVNEYSKSVYFTII